MKSKMLIFNKVSLKTTAPLPVGLVQGVYMQFNQRETVAGKPIEGTRWQKCYRFAIVDA